MPEVNDVYYSKETGAAYVVTAVTEGGLICVTNSKMKVSTTWSLLNFNTYFEEIPSEPKQQPTWPKEIQEAIKNLQKTMFETPENSAQSLSEGYLKLLRASSDLLRALHLTETEERVHEEKDCYCQKFPDGSVIPCQPCVEKMVNEASEKKGFEVKMSCGLCGVEMKEVDGVHEVCNCSSGFKSVNYVCEAERSKKTSIWKDVSERPEKNDVSIIWLKDGGKVIAAYHSITGRWLLRSENRPSGFEVFLPEYIQAWCDIADFFNQAESDHVAIAELRERLDKLKGK